MGKRTETNYIVIHCSATRANQNVTFDDIKRWHTMERAFFDIGYHWVIERDGSVKQGRPVDDWGAHAKSHNHESVSICLVGGLDDNNQSEDNFTPLQKRMLKLLVAGHQALYPEAIVHGHYHLSKVKACPNFDVHRWLIAEGLLGEKQ
ncbi:N-acetylmuramoyl-L-alanine amidase [Endozoicomonas gorgoniicola]|uniref:N-acetylmuramoyl-L-alanine amidase n=1 Tax=Endozoicomonas gorgoniicola TaxID=1234144 RepID=A0ABT3MUC2_9GAMM|nr:N-acetylmuramoyl-L-alanine amidase [Endozoicomonas gorgoniicola]MCW7552986.1 N-acetylmuramoyl-L-alanine amidase [Endozoicomonas gorgoniicola]